MNVLMLHRLGGAIVFLASFVTYLLTTYPSLSFWDCGEFIATTSSLSVPHAPGAPFFALYSKVIGLIPYAGNYALRLNIVSCLASAFTILFVYLIAVKLITLLRKAPTLTIADAIVVFGSAIVGAMALAWCDTFWFNAIEAEVYASSMFFLSLIVWLSLRWHEQADEPHSERYLLLIAYLLGLSIGVHQLSLLAYFGVALVVYFRRFTPSVKSFLLFGMGAVGLFFIIYPGIVLWLPDLLDGKLAENAPPTLLVQLIPLILVVAAIYGIYYSYKTRHAFLNVAITSALLVLMGYSTYTLVLVRAGENPPINEGNPSTLERLVQYLNREQYGQTPLLRGSTFNNIDGQVDTDPQKDVLFPRRWNPEEQHVSYYKRYDGDGDYFIRYQANHMFLRYLFWNFVGRSGDIQDAPPHLAGSVKGGPENGVWTLQPETFPNAYWGIPFLLGLIGITSHFRRDWKIAAVLASLFVVLGFVLVFYFNMAEPQPRERDYFFVGAFVVFALWIAIGVAACAEFVSKRSNRKMLLPALAIVLCFIIAPVNMARQNWHDHNHSSDWVPWDLSYNTLQSCDKDGILFTNGDNDTFPLWYLQEVEGVRRDVRVICLSLLNLDWYSLQLKNETPHGALKVPVSFEDDEIVRFSKFDDRSISQFGWREESKQLSVPVPDSLFRKYVDENPPGLDTTGSVQSPSGGRELRWTAKSRFPVRTTDGGVIYIRQWQDIMTEDIIKTNVWQRPIYFAITCTPDAFIGLDNYLRMEGLAYRLTPVAGPQNAYLDEERMRAHLFHAPKSLSQAPALGFVFRGLNDRTQYFDENAQRLVLNYRNSFLRFALYYQQVKRDNARAIETLDRMFSVAPREAIPMDYRLQYDIASMYRDAGARESYRKLTEEIEPRCWSEIARNPYDVTSFYNPYRFLLEMYQERTNYTQAIAVLDTLLKYHPEIEDVKQKRQELISLVNQQK